jgi:hypothetical protein
MNLRATNGRPAQSPLAAVLALAVGLWVERAPLQAQGYQFSYHQLANNHQQVFGLAAGDLDGDGDLDLVSGAALFRNPGGDLFAPWTRTPLPVGDAFFVVDVDGDAFADVVANHTPDIEWLEATDLAGTQWVRRAIVGQVPANSGFHATGQGSARAQIRAGGREELAFSGHDSRVYYFEIPAQNPAAGNWPRVEITAQASEDGIALADIDGDGLADLVAADMYGTIDNVVWFRNPGTGAGNWPIFRIGRTGGWVDRVGSADLDGDGRLDIVVTEENIGSAPDANVYWYRQPANPTSGNWSRQLLVRQYTTNSLDLGDVDGDGDVDVVTGEHRGTKELALWLNDGSGQFTRRLVDAGKESHLGGRLFDLDRDGDLDLVSIAYDGYPFVHLWRHDRSGQPAGQFARAGSPANPQALLRSATSPTLGGVFAPRVDHAFFLPFATGDVLLLALQTANQPTPYGTLLCGSIVGSLSVGAGAPFALPVPNDQALLGASLVTQAVSIDAGGVIALTNAIDLTLGNF